MQFENFYWLCQKQIFNTIRRCKLKTERREAEGVGRGKEGKEMNVTIA